MIRETLLSLHQQKKGREALRAIKKTITRLVTVQNSDYDNLRGIIKELAVIGVK